MSDSENESYTSDHNENIENIEKPTGRNSPVIYEEQENIYKKPIKPKRVMSEKQLENLKKARLIAHAKLKDKKKETQLMKKKEQELKILKKLDKNITVDKKIKDLKNKIVYTPKDNKEDEIFYLKKPSKQRAILQAEKPKKKKIVYITDSESEEEILYLKKPRARATPTKAQPNEQAPNGLKTRTRKQPWASPAGFKNPQQQFIEDLDEHEKIEKETQDKIVEKHYNDKIALIKREYLMKSVFQP